MHIAVLGFIGTNDLLPFAVRQQLGKYPKGREGAPLITNLIHEYIRRGHKVLAITVDQHLNDDEPPFVYESDLLTFVVVPYRHHIFRPNGKRMGRTADFFRFERKQMKAVLQRYQPDVVHAHWTYEFALSALDYTPNALVTVHDNAQIIFNYVRTLNRFFHVLMARYVFWKGRFFTAVSPYMADTVQPWTKHTVAVVPNPVLMPSTPYTKAAPGDLIISMVVNGWDDRKNSKKALLAFKEIQRLHPTAVLWAFGTAFESDQGAPAFCALHQIPNVTLYGMKPHDEVLRKVAQSTILLHTSLEESFGMVLAEAMSFGVPVVGGKDSGAVPWVVDNGGLLVDVTDVAEIVKAVDRLFTDTQLYEQLSANAIRVVQTRFPIQRVADQYFEQYEQCQLANKQAQPALTA